MPTPIEELTAREMAEGRQHTLGPQHGQPIQPELIAVAVVPGAVGGGPLAVASTPTPVASPTAPIEAKPLAPSFLRHLQEEIVAEEAKEAGDVATN